jgi:hypothetical protein
MKKITPLNDKVISPSVVVQELADSLAETDAVLILAIDKKSRVTLSYSTMSDSDVTMLAACLQAHVFKRLENP